LPTTKIATSNSPYYYYYDIEEKTASHPNAAALINKYRLPPIAVADFCGFAGGTNAHMDFIMHL